MTHTQTIISTTTNYSNFKISLPFVLYSKTMHKKGKNEVINFRNLHYLIFYVLYKMQDSCIGNSCFAILLFHKVLSCLTLRIPALVLLLFLQVMQEQDKDKKYARLLYNTRADLCAAFGRANQSLQILQLKCIFIHFCFSSFCDHFGIQTKTCVFVTQ